MLYWTKGYSLGANRDNVQDISESDPVLRFVSRKKYDELSSTERNQLALDAYLRKSKTAWQVGIAYERYLGYLHEEDGWTVSYEGAIKGLEDFGRDLICSKGETVKIIQAKNWRSERTIREKHIFQLFGTTVLYKVHHSGQKISVKALFFSGAAPFSKEAQEVAKQLKINLRMKPHSYDYPMIKCNINHINSKRIYHLPFDQQYDRVVIDKKRGEFYAKTAQEAEKAGFRRAFKYHGPF